MPDETEPGIVALHLKRYEFARPHCVGKDVLDAGCGVGYGSAFLGVTARTVLGVDVSREAIDYARARYGGENVEFAVDDLQALERTDGEFDVVVAFEVIEHLPHPERFVAQARRVVKSDGVLVVSTPRAEHGQGRPENPFHEREFSPGEFEHLLRGSFGRVDLYGQRRLQTSRHRALQRLDVLGLRRRLAFLRRASRVVTGTAPMDAVSSEGVEISQDGVDEATELIAVCRP